MHSKNSNENFVPVKRVILLVDLAGAAKAMQSDDAKMIQFIQDYYAVCDKAVSGKGGTVIKFMGDGCLAVFSAENARNAVDAALELRSTITELASRYSLAVTMGANLHLAPVVDAEFGVGSSRRRDIMGRGVNQAFLLGRGGEALNFLEAVAAFHALIFVKWQLAFLSGSLESFRLA